MPRGSPKAQHQSVELVRTLVQQTEPAQMAVVEERLDAVAQFQEKLEGELDSHFTFLRGVRNDPPGKESAPGVKAAIEATKVMMEHTHRLHPDKMGPQGERVTVNVLVQMLTKPG